MFSSFRNVRKGEGLAAWVGFATLFALIASHSVLETARDALFLSKVPASQLPWVYIAIAAISLVATQVQARVGGGLERRAALSLWTAGAAAITAAFWLLLPALGDAGLYALYAWSGVLTTLVLVHFWLLLGDLFTVTQAKRLYAMIGAGSVLGAIFGTGVASVLTRMVDARDLVLVSAVGFTIAATLPWRFGTIHAQGAPSERQPLRESAAYVMRNLYTRQLALLLVISTVALTLADYVFKATVAASIPPDELGAFFATLYLVLNVLSLGAQLVLVSWLLRRTQLSTALMVLPVLLLVGAVWLLGSSAVVAAIFLKGADGTLRYSLHRTSTELLYVPLSESARARTKAFLDVLGQRGGQTLASVFILALVAAGAPAWVFAATLGLACLAWCVAAAAVQGPYLEIFRGRLRGQGIDAFAEFPDLDVASLETLVATLDSTNDDEVLAAMGVLEREDKTRLVPALILYHPSERVVLAALELFTRAVRTNVVPAMKHLEEHPSVDVRAAIVATRAVLAYDERWMRMRLIDDAPEVRATVHVNLIVAGDIIGSDARDALEAMLRTGSVSTRIALAQAIARRRAGGFEDTLVRLAGATEPDVRRAAATAMGTLQSPEFLDTLLGLLPDQHTTGLAREVISGFGDRGLQAAVDALSDREQAPGLRWQIPHTIARFEPQPAAAALLTHLPHEWDNLVRYRTVRALEALVRRHPDLSLDRGTLDEVVHATVSRAFRYLDRQLTLARGAEVDPTLRTDGHGLLVRVLADKRRQCQQRLLRLLGLANPHEDFARIRTGLDSSAPQTRASSLELLAATIRSPLREAVLALVDDLPDDQRLAAAGRYHRPQGHTYESLLDRMLDSESHSVREVTIFHIGELRLTSLRDRVSALGGADAEHALSRMAGAEHAR